MGSPGQSLNQTMVNKTQGFNTTSIQTSRKSSSNSFKFPSIFNSKLKYSQNVTSIYKTPTEQEISHQLQQEKQKIMEEKVRRVSKLVGEAPQLSHFYTYKNIDKINIRTQMTERY